MAPQADEPEQDVRADPRHAADPGGELLCRIAERDVRAFEILYRRYVRSIYGLALRRLRDPSRAEDATREAFAAIWRRAATFGSERDDTARWLFAVARDAIDHAGRESAAEEGWPAFRVHAAVAELPDRERGSLELAYWEGRSQREIADLLGLPLGTVNARTRTALARLAVRLEVPP